MADDERSFLICGSVGDPLLNIEPETERGFYCSICATEIWMSKFMRAHWAEHPKHIPVCAPCGVALSEDDDKPEIRGVRGDAHAPFAKQIHQGLKRIYGKGHEGG